MPHVATPDPADLAELVDLVRLLIADVEPTEQVYQDFELESLLHLEAYEPKLAAAQALDTYASHIAQVAGPVRGLLDIRVGGEQSARVLFEHAGRLRSQVPFIVGIGTPSILVEE